MIYCPNHVSYYDPPVVGCGVPYGLRFMAWDALFTVPVLGAFIRSVGAFPVKLKSADKAAIETTLKALKNGAGLMIFPEGGRSNSGELMPFEAGAARMALQTGAALVPVSVLGIYEAWSPADTVPNLFKPIVVVYHDAIQPPKEVAKSDVKSTIEALNDQIKTQIARQQEAWRRLKRLKAHRGVWG